MSKLVAFAAIQGAYNIVAKAEGKYRKALETFGGSQKLEFMKTQKEQIPACIPSVGPSGSPYRYHGRPARRQR